MPNAFDLSNYAANFDPTKSPFYSIQDILKAGENIWPQVFEVLKEWLPSIIQALPTLIEDMLELAIDLFLQILQDITGWDWTSLESLIPGLVSGIGDFIKLPLALLQFFFGNWPGLFTHPLELFSLVTDVIQLAIDLLTLNFPAALTDVSHLLSVGFDFNALFNAFNDLLGGFGLVSSAGGIAEQIVFMLTGTTGPISALAPWAAGLLTGGVAVISDIVGLAAMLVNLSPSGIFSPGGIGAGALASGVTMTISQIIHLATLLVGFDTSGTGGSLLGQMISAGGGSGSTLADFAALLGTATSIAVTGITGLASGVLGWLSGGGALPGSTTLGVGGLTGLATGILSWLTGGGALPGGTTLGAGALTGLATGLGSWLTGGGALPSATTLGVSGLTGLAAGILSWLTGGGALPSATTLGAGGLTGLATGLGSWLTGGGALPSATTLGGSQLTGLGSGVGSWLGSGGALPSGSTATIGQVINLATLLGGFSTSSSILAQLPSLLTLAPSAITGLTDLITNSVGVTGPFGFITSGTNTLGNVGTAIADATTLAQQLLDTVVRTNTGATGSGFSLAQFATALNQQPGSTIATLLPTSILPDITAEMSSGIQAVQATSGLNASDISDIVQYAEQESAAALGTFIGNTGGIAQGAQAFAGGAVDTINTVLGGIPVVGSELDDLFNQFTGFLTQTHNNWTGSSLPAATAPDVAAAALNSATQANAQSVLIASIQQQLPKFYGAGASGLAYQTGFAGSLPAGFVAFTPGTGPCYNCAINTSQAAQTTTQAASAIWTLADGWNKCLIIRSNAAGTTHTYAIFGGGGVTIGCRVAGVNHVLGTAAGVPFAANYAYQFEGVGRLLTLTGPNGLNVSVTDSGNVSTINANTKYAGYGTDGSIIASSTWAAAGNYTFHPPAGLANGDFYDIYGAGAGGGGGGGVNAWGNGGGGGGYSELWGTTAIGSTAGSTIIGNAGAPALGASIAVTIGGAGPPGSSEYYRTYEEEYYSFGGNSGIINDSTPANYGTSGSAGGTTSASWSGGNVVCPGGSGGAAYGGSPAGGVSGWYNTQQTGETLVNASAPAYNGDNAFQSSQGGSGCYSGTGQTNATSWYDQFANHWLGWQDGVNAAQTAGWGADGIMGIDSVSRQLPGPVASFAFWDAAIAGPTAGLAYPASWSESTTSATWVDLPTTTDQVTVNVGPSGIVIVGFHCNYAWATVAGTQCWVSIDVTGANTIPVLTMDGTYAYSAGMAEDSGLDCAAPLTFFGVFGVGAMPPLSPGATTFKLKYSGGGPAGTSNFGPRSIFAIPL